jgi:hypothetical protein
MATSERLEAGRVTLAAVGCRETDLSQREVAKLVDRSPAWVNQAVYRGREEVEDGDE